jgi:hypothetical protein
VANVGRLALGRPIEPAPADATYARLLTMLGILAFLQLGRAGWALRRRAGERLLWLSVVFDCGVLLLFTLALPRLWSLHLNTMVFIQPDLAYLMLGIVAFTAAMLIIRLSWLLLRGLRERSRTAEA